MAKRQDKKRNPARVQTTAGFSYNSKLGLFLPNKLNALYSELGR